MPNTSTTKIVSFEVIQASIILPIMDRYMFVLFYILGFIGSLLNIFIFLHKRLRIKSCSTYFLANSIVDFCYINSFILIELLSLFNKQLGNTIGLTDAWCKMGNYFFFLLPCLASTYITLASIDRFCASSSNEYLQKFNQLKLSYILTFIILFIWLLFSLHIPISYNRYKLTPTSSIQCNPQLNIAAIFIIIDGYFFALYNGIIVPILLIIFGLLIFHNVKILHQRVLPQPASITTTTTTTSNINHSLTKGNQHLINILLFQVSLTIFLHIPYIILYLYGIYDPLPTNNLLLLLYYIFTYIARWFWIMNFSKTFYINILSSQTYRNIFKRKIIQFIIPIYQQNTIHRTIPQTSSHQSDLELTQH